MGHAYNRWRAERACRSAGMRMAPATCPLCRAGVGLGAGGPSRREPAPQAARHRPGPRPAHAPLPAASAALSSARALLSRSCTSPGRSSPCCICCTRAVASGRLPEGGRAGGWAGRCGVGWEAWRVGSCAVGPYLAQHGCHAASRLHLWFDGAGRPGEPALHAVLCCHGLIQHAKNQMLLPGRRPEVPVVVTSAHSRRRALGAQHARAWHAPLAGRPLPHLSRPLTLRRPVPKHTPHTRTPRP